MHARLSCFHIHRLLYLSCCLAIALPEASASSSLFLAQSNAGIEEENSVGIDFQLFAKVLAFNFQHTGKKARVFSIFPTLCASEVHDFKVLRGQQKTLFALSTPFQHPYRLARGCLLALRVFDRMQTSEPAGNSTTRVAGSPSTRVAQESETRWNSRECIAEACADCMTDTCIGRSCSRVNRMLVRYIYAFLFLLTLLVAWMVRDYSYKALSELPNLRYCGGDPLCLGSEGVLRVSFGCFCFFFTMYVSTVGTHKATDPRDLWHTGWWPVKSLLWILSMVLPFFMPPTCIKFYGEVARFGGGIFLVVQLLAVLNFIYWWNENWLSDKNVQQCQMPMLCVSLGSFAVSILGITMMYIWFAPRASCGLNIFLITWSLILIQIMTSISLHSKVNAGLLTSGLMALYVVFLGWSALLSEPASEACNSKPRLNGRGDWITVLSFLLGAFTLILAAFSTGIEPKSLSFQKDEGERSEKIPYGYGFFHFVFCLGAMYFVMLFIGWDLEQTMEKWTIDFGWSTVWVKVINQWLAACFYVWTMIGPLVLKHTDFA